MEVLERIFKFKEYQTIRDCIEDTVARNNQSIAFTLKEKDKDDVKYRDITYAKFYEECKEFGTGLIDLGFENERIAILGRNSYKWSVSYVSISCGVGITVPLDKELQYEELKSSLIRSEAKAIIFDEKYVNLFKKLKDDKEVKVSQYICMEKEEGFLYFDDVVKKGSELIEKGNMKFDNHIPKPNDMATLIFTSGTTSLSKAVVLSQYNIASNVYELLSVEFICNKDTNMFFLPFHHTLGSTGMLFFLGGGVRNVFCDGLRYIQKNMQEYKVTIFLGVPLLLEAMYKKIWQGIDKEGKTKLVKKMIKLCRFLLKLHIDIRRKIFKQILDQLGGELRFIVSGASAISKEVVQGFSDFGILTVQGYGLTETSPVLTCENERHIRFGSIGLPFQSVQLRIDEKDENGIGELVVKSPSVMQGYYNNPEENAKVFEDGWFHTGDLGYVDKDGYVFLTGRKKNVIVLKNGKNVYPEEIEKLIADLPYVAENIIYGEPKDDDVLLTAKVVYNKEYVEEKYGDIKEKELHDIIWNDIKKINESLPVYKYIKGLIITDVPMKKTTTAKIKRYEEIKNK